MSYDREQRVRERAYALWDSAGRPAGREHEFWLQAEREVAADEPQPDPAPPPA